MIRRNRLPPTLIGIGSAFGFIDPGSKYFYVLIEIERLVFPRSEGFVRGL